jgi:tRNA (guanine37-N1)-methyltransferase
MDAALRTVLTSVYSNFEEAMDIERLEILVPSASGKRFDQPQAERMALSLDHMVILCPRFEGFDQRIVDLYRGDGFVIDEYSIGDFVTFGAEAPTLSIIEAVARLVPGVIGNRSSLETESFAEAGLLEFPQYTKPNPYRGLAVPEVLVQGNHKLIEQFRCQSAKTKTEIMRPDLLQTPNDLRA